MDAGTFSNILNTLVITTIFIFVVCLGLYGYFHLREKLKVRK
jgi:hypothetical protein